ncbi:MAG: citrate (Si)-synthase [Anaerolineae bacterium]|nr:citrate (Si)-synthase [Anaerolineae bacterium]
MTIKEMISAQIPKQRERYEKLIKDHGDTVIAEVTIRQILDGMRGIKSLLTDVSFVDPEEGIRFRSMTIAEVLDALPKPEGADMPYIGGLYYLLMIGEIPTREQALEVDTDWRKRCEVPKYIFDILRTMPNDAHPMALLSVAVMALEPESEFSKRFHKGMKKVDYWEPALEDSLNLTAKLPVIAAFIYNLKYKDGKEPEADPNLDLGANFAQMIGVEDQKGYADLARLYFIIHSDHESGNASAHATHLSASTLSNIYYAYSAGLSTLAGPLHGLANQKSLELLLEIRKKFGGLPTKEQLRKFTWDRLEQGRLIPGYGHAVLRVPDPRFIAQMKFAKKRFPDDTLVQIAEMVFEIVPKVLIEQGKAKNPAPNVDAISGPLQYHYGVKEFEFYTVLFGVSRAMGVTANYVWARVLGQPIERPKSMTMKMLEEFAAAN